LLQTEKISKEVLSLPMHPDLGDDQITYICEHVAKFFTA